MKLGVLQFNAGKSHDVKDILQLAIEADGLGYSRFWLGEHYTNIDWNNPEALLPIILGLTENIRVGTAGILLRLHSPFRIACTFKLMCAVFQDRLDLGLGGGVTANEKAIKLLTNLDVGGFSEIDFNKKIEELMYYFNHEAELLNEGVTVAPIQIQAPPVWLLSSSFRSLPTALELKCNLSRSLFHQNSALEPDKEALLQFREDYYQKHGIAAEVNLAFAGVCAPSVEEATKRFQESSYSGNTFLLPNLIGTPEQFAEMLHGFESKFGVDEFVFFDMSEDHAHRVWSLEVLSEVCGLQVPVMENAASFIP